MARPAKNCFGVRKEDTSVSWRVWYRLANTKPTWITLQKAAFTTRASAMAEVGRLYKVAVDGESATQKREKTTFEELAAKIKASKPPEAQKVFQQGFNNFLKFHTTRFQEFNEERLLEYKNHARAVPRSMSTINRELVYLCEIGIAASRYGYIKTFDKFKVVFFKEKEILRNMKRKERPTQEDRKVLLKICREDEPYFHLWLSLVIRLGWRRGEIRQVRWGDINFKEMFIRLRSTKLGDQDRYFNESILEALLLHKDILRKRRKYSDTGLVYPSYRKGGDQSGKGSLDNVIDRLLLSAGIKRPLTSHCFRGYVSNALRQAGTSPVVIAAITGHTEGMHTIDTHYTWITPEGLEKAFEVIKV